MSSKSNVDSTSSTRAQPTKRLRLASPTELAQPAPEPALITPDDTVTPTSPPLPLTRENLRALTEMSSAGPSTPSKGGSSQAPSGSSKVPAEIRRDLENYNIFVDKFERHELEDPVNDLITRYVDRPRSSPGITKEKHAEIRKLFRENANTAEAGLTDALVDRIFTEPKYLLEHTGVLARVRDDQFDKKALPVPDTTNDVNLRILLQQTKFPGAPKPDYTFGLKRPGPFSDNETAILKSFKDIKILEGIDLPFFVVEWKSEGHGGNSHVAVSQAARGGASIVNTTRLLYAKIAPNGNPSSLPYANLTARTACFSCVISGYTIGLYVHYYRFVKNTIQWHSTHIFDTPIREEHPPLFERLHTAIHNILDWGTGERLAQIHDVLDKVDTLRKAASTPALKRKAPSSSP